MKKTPFIILSFIVLFLLHSGNASLHPTMCGTLEGYMTYESSIHFDDKESILQCNHQFCEHQCGCVRGQKCPTHYTKKFCHQICSLSGKDLQNLPDQSSRIQCNTKAEKEYETKILALKSRLVFIKTTLDLVETPQTELPKIFSAHASFIQAFSRYEMALAPLCESCNMHIPCARRMMVCQEAQNLLEIMAEINRKLGYLYPWKKERQAAHSSA